LENAFDSFRGLIFWFRIHAIIKVEIIDAINQTFVCRRLDGSELLGVAMGKHSDTHIKEAPMLPSLHPGLSYEFKYEVPTNKTVPHLLPEATELQQMPEVLATGFMVGLIEWTCIQAISPHIDWPREQSVGIYVDLSHTAPTPPGFTLTVKVTLTAVEGRKLTFDVVADDGVDQITKGTHQRFVIDAAKFNQNVAQKAGKKP
jgi:fluoroacetyl-CoA thioesterase